MSGICFFAVDIAVGRVRNLCWRVMVLHVLSREFVVLHSVVRTACFITLLQAGGSNLVNSKLAAKKLEGLFGKRFCKDICNLMRRGDIASYEGTNGYLFSNEVVVNFNMFCSGVKDRVNGHV